MPVNIEKEGKKSIRLKPIADDSHEYINFANSLKGHSRLKFRQVDQRLEDVRILHISSDTGDDNRFEIKGAGMYRRALTDEEKEQGKKIDPITCMFEGTVDFHTKEIELS